MSAAGAPVLVVDGLTARPGTRELRRFWRAFATANPQVAAPGERVRRIVLAIGAAVSWLGLLAMIMGTVSNLTRGRDVEPDDAVGMIVMTALFAIAFPVLVWAAVRTGRRRMRPRQHWALARFAADNGFAYLPGPARGDLPSWSYRGSLTKARAIRARTTRGRPIEWCDYENRYGNSASHHTQFGGWIRIGLRRPLPHIVLRATQRGARVLSTASVPDSSQRLSLEGDFDSHFALYCPSGYERDALYLFTPDVMARAVDEAGGWDIEIVDDVLLLTRSRDVVTTDPAEWSEIIRTTVAFAGKIEQWERWRDDRAEVEPDGAMGLPVAGVGVAAGGRRLRTAWSTATWVWIALGAALIATVVIANLL